MTVNDILLAIVVHLSIAGLKKMDWTNGYNCPPYCDVNHDHIGLDWQSSFKSQNTKNAKSNKIKDLGAKKNYCNLRQNLVN